MSKIHKRRDMTLKEKLNILEEYDKLGKVSQRSAATKLNISQPLLCKILKSRDAIQRAAIEKKNMNSKRNRCGKDKLVEAALKYWFTHVRDQDTHVNGPFIRQKAEELAELIGRTDFKATDGWLERWRKRENIVYNENQKETNDTDVLDTEKWLEHEWTKLTAEYSMENIFYADETALYYRALPEHTLIFMQESTNISNERVTIFYCVNMAGEKEQLVVINKNKNTECLKIVKKLPVDYYSNTSALMTTMIFNEWLVKWDKRLKRDILLLISNNPSHSINVSLTHIKIVLLPANTQSILQSCNQGINRTIKAHYRVQMRTRALESIDKSQNLSADEIAKEISFLDALHLLSMSWYQISPTTILNSFKQAKLCTNELHKFEEIEALCPADMDQNEFESWLEIDSNIIAQSPIEEVICEPVVMQQKTEEISDDDESDLNFEAANVPTNAEMRRALNVLRRGVHALSNSFQEHYRYENFINEILKTRPKQEDL